MEIITNYDIRNANSTDMLIRWIHLAWNKNEKHLLKCVLDKWIFVVKFKLLKRLSQGINIKYVLREDYY